MAYPIPNLPTDNLYKFMALSGVVLIIVSSLFMEINFSRLDTLVNQVKGQQAQVDTFRNLAKTKDVMSNIEYLEEAMKLIQSNEMKISEMNTILDRTGQHLVLMSVLFGLGLANSLLGFYFWYTRVQKPMDKLLILNLEDAQSKREASSNQDHTNDPPY